MGDFAVNVFNRDDVAVSPPAGLTLTPVTFGAVALGGFDSAEIEVTGPELAIHTLRSWLRYRIEIVGAAGLVWEGFVDEAMLNLPGVTVSVGTERMYNAIKVIYSYTGDDGGAETGETDWATDADSISEFGRKEAIHSSGGETTQEAAEALRATVLAGTKKASSPTITVEGASTEASAVLYCNGRYRQLEWRYHEDTGGYEAHEQTGERILIGWTYTSNSIGFVQTPYNRLCDYNSQLGGLDEDDQLLVSGTYGGSNNGVKVVKGKVGGEPESYVAATISFEPADDVRDSAGGFGFVRAKEAIAITGTTGGLNDGVYLSSDVTSDTRFEVAMYGAHPVVTQAAGPSVTIAQAQAVELVSSPVNEPSGNTVTLTAYGQSAAMRFELTNGPWTCGEVGVHIAKFGSPSDNVNVSIYSDSGSNTPNTLLANGTIAPADVPSQTAAWRTCRLVTPVTLANATKYHVVVGRAGSSHHANYYTVSCDSDSSYPRGDLRLWDGSAWQTRYNGGHMAFKLWATMDSTVKIGQIVAAAAGVVSSSFAAVTAGVRTRQLRDGRTSAWEEIVQLLQTGNSAGARILAKVSPGGTLMLDYETSFDVAPIIMWTRDGRLRMGSGRYVLPGVLPVGGWVQIEALLTADWQADTTRFLVDTAEYNAQSGRWTLRPKEAADPFDLGTEQG